MTIKDRITKNKLPEHIAVIMDGNGRWARKKGNKRIFGHRNGIVAVRETVEGCAELGIKYLTLYAFSTENWNRPKLEVDALMSLLVTSLHNENETLMDNNVKLLVIGNINSLPKDVKLQLKETIKNTSLNTGLTLILALSYGGRWEITEAVKLIASDIMNKKISINDIKSDTIIGYLQTFNIPDPELLIRTSGEFRISNFLLWQIAYTELYFTNTLWPDFRKNDLYLALIDYQKRERRFGKITE